MSFKDGEMRAISVLGTFVVTSALFLPVIYLTEAAEASHTKWDDMESIEASIAYKKTPQKQPQKQTHEVEKPKDNTISHDENKKPVDECKVNKDCKTDEKCEDHRCVAKKIEHIIDPKAPINFGSNSRPDDDSAAGKPTTQPGDFNGNEFGWAPQSKGHPFWQHFAKDIHDNFLLPSISEANGFPVGCFHITPDGKIADIKIKEKSESTDLQQAAEHAIDAVKKLRNDNPEPVPTELLGATNRWICFRFDPNKT
jgi:outer membrane biosynthesis protein TonB